MPPAQLILHGGRWIVNLGADLAYSAADIQAGEALALELNAQLEHEDPVAQLEEEASEHEDPDEPAAWPPAVLNAGVVVGAVSVVTYAAVTAAGQAFITALITASVTALLTLKLQAGFSAREATFALVTIVVLSMSYLLVSQQITFSQQLAINQAQNDMVVALFPHLRSAGHVLNYSGAGGDTVLRIEKGGGGAESAAHVSAVTCTGPTARVFILACAGDDGQLDMKEAEKLDGKAKAKALDKGCEWPTGGSGKCFEAARPLAAKKLDVDGAASFLACRVNALPSAECRVSVCAD